VVAAIAISLAVAGSAAPARSANAGFSVGEVRPNDYRFVSDRALEACNTYSVESVSLVAVRDG
jgi:hypothetical protein